MTAGEMATGLALAMMFCGVFFAAGAAFVGIAASVGLPPAAAWVAAGTVLTVAWVAVTG